MANPLSGINTFLMKVQFTGAIRGKLYRQLADYLDTGLPINGALHLILEKEYTVGKKDDYTAIALREWQENFEEGDLLGDAARNWITAQERYTINSGQQSNRLSSSLRQLEELNMVKQGMFGKLAMQMAYPLILNIFLLAIFAGEGKNLIDELAGMTNQEAWGIDVIMLDKLIWFAGNLALPVAIGLLILLGVFIYSLPRWTGPVRGVMDRHFPYSVYRNIQGASFLGAMSALTASSASEVDALRMLREDATPWYRWQLRQVHRKIEEGHDLGSALSSTVSQFPSPVSNAELRVYAELESISEPMQKLSSNSLKGMKEMTERIGNLMYNTGLVIGGSMMALFYLGLYGLTGLVQ